MVVTALAPVQVDAAVQAGPSARAINDNISLVSSTVDSEGSPFHGSPPPSSAEDGVDLSLLWMPPGDMEFASRVVFATINEDAPTASPAPFIRGAMFSVANNVHFRMFPSSQGHMMLVFNSTF